MVSTLFVEHNYVVRSFVLNGTILGVTFLLGQRGEEKQQSYPQIITFSDSLLALVKQSRNPHIVKG